MNDILKRMEELENKLKSEIGSLYDEAIPRIEKLEKGLITADGQNCISVLSAQQNNNIIELAELKNQFIEKNRGINRTVVNDNAKLRERINVDIKKHDKDIVELRGEIAELKEQIKKIVDPNGLALRFTKGNRNDIDNTIVVLREIQRIAICSADFKTFKGLMRVYKEKLDGEATPYANGQDRLDGDKSVSPHLEEDKKTKIAKSTLLTESQPSSIIKKLCNELCPKGHGWVYNDCYGCDKNPAEQEPYHHEGDGKINGPRDIEWLASKEKEPPEAEYSLSEEGLEAINLIIQEYAKKNNLILVEEADLEDLIPDMYELYHKIDFESELDKNFYMSFIKRWEKKVEEYLKGGG